MLSEVKSVNDPNKLTDDFFHFAYPNGRVVDCLWCWTKDEVEVRKVWISVPESNRPIGSTDGRDDWGHYVIPRKGKFNGKKFDWLDIGPWLNWVLGENNTY